MQFDNIYSLCRERAAKYNDKPVIFTREEDGWTSQTWNEFAHRLGQTGRSVKGG